MCAHEHVTFVYASEQQYRAALVVVAMSWMGPEVDPQVDRWAVESLVLLTSPRGEMYMEDGRVLVSNGRDRGLVLDCTQAGV